MEYICQLTVQKSQLKLPQQVAIDHLYQIVSILIKEIEKNKTHRVQERIKVLQTVINKICARKNNIFKVKWGSSKKLCNHSTRGTLPANTTT